MPICPVIEPGHNESGYLCIVLLYLLNSCTMNPFGSQSSLFFLRMCALESSFTNLKNIFKCSSEYNMCADCVRSSRNGYQQWVQFDFHIQPKRFHSDACVWIVWTASAKSKEWREQKETNRTSIIELILIFFCMCYVICIRFISLFFFLCSLFHSHHSVTHRKLKNVCNVLRSNTNISIIRFTRTHTRARPVYLHLFRFGYYFVFYLNLFGFVCSSYFHLYFCVSCPVAQSTHHTLTQRIRISGVGKTRKK